MLLFHEVCHSSKMYLLIDGLKSENGILKEVGSNESEPTSFKIPFSDFLSCVCYAFVRVCFMCLVVTCWERTDLLVSFEVSNCEFVTFPLVSWVRCGT